MTSEQLLVEYIDAQVAYTDALREQGWHIVANALMQRIAREIQETLEQEQVRRLIDA